MIEFLSTKIFDKIIHNNINRIYCNNRYLLILTNILNIEYWAETMAKVKNVANVIMKKIPF